MNRRIQISAIMCASAIVITLLGSPFVSEAYAETCVGAGPQICVDFLNAGDPLFLQDFTVDFADPENPDVTLIKGSLFWQVRSRVGPPPNDTPANIGDITLNPAVNTDDFGVKIANGTGAGAANVGSMILKSASFLWMGHSSIKTGSHITGSLSGALTVIKDSGGDGGEVTLIIDTDSSGTMTIPVLKTLTIGGNLSGDLTVSEKIDCGGSLSVAGSVGSLVDISIADLCNAAVDFDSDISGDSFFGDLVLLGGVPSGSTVKFHGPVEPGTTVDLNNASVGGFLQFFHDNSAVIVNGGDVSGIVTLSFFNGFPFCFSGSAVFASMSLHGGVGIANLAGRVMVTGDINQASIGVSGEFSSTGNIAVNGTLGGGGLIAFGGSVTGGDTRINALAGGTVLIIPFVPVSSDSVFTLGDMANGPFGPSRFEAQFNFGEIRDSHLFWGN